MTTSTQQNLESFLQEHDIPHSENNFKNWSTHLALLNHWTKCPSEIPYVDAEFEPQARANYDLVRSKAGALGVPLNNFHFSDVYEEAHGKELAMSLYNLFVVEGKTVSPLKRQAYEERRSKFGDALDWKKELQIAAEVLDFKEEGTEQTAPATEATKDSVSAEETGYGKYAVLSVMALASLLGAGVMFKDSLGA